MREVPHPHARARDAWHVSPASTSPALPPPPSLPRAQKFGFINDVKAGVPRTAYAGVVHIRHNGCVKLLVPADFKPPRG